MKSDADQKRTDREFAIGDWVFLRLQPYRQHFLVALKNLKLSPRFYGPYQILERIGQVGYKLDLPVNSNSHPVFHVSLLKKTLGQHTSPLTSLPLVDDQRELLQEPTRILKSQSQQQDH